MARSRSDPELTSSRSDLGYKDCPLDRAQLGYATWSLLHTIAAYYPKYPTSSEQQDMLTFIRVLSRFYPCSICASNFQKELNKFPPDVTCQRNFSRWVCTVHNHVNQRLGKPIFDCKLVDQRWRDGWNDGSCN